MRRVKRIERFAAGFFPKLKVMSTSSFGATIGNQATSSRRVSLNKTEALLTCATVPSAAACRGGFQIRRQTFHRQSFPVRISWIRKVESRPTIGSSPHPWYSCRARRDGWRLWTGAIEKPLHQPGVRRVNEAVASVTCVCLHRLCSGGGEWEVVVHVPELVRDAIP